jgi:oxaloacetate decarboxylase alpha subunit
VNDVRIIDTTLRDGQQSLWATRMTTKSMLPILPVLDSAGFASIEFMSTVQMDACVRYLGENPWDRMRLVKKHVTRTPLRMLGMSQFFSISTVLPDDIIDLFTRTCARAGIDEVWITASMNDTRTAEVAIRAAKAEGSWVAGGVQFTISPVHTDEFFVQVARELIAFGVDAIVLKDAGGLLTPERVAVLLPLLIDVAGSLPVQVHSHCVTGFGPASNLEAVKAGADAIWTSSTPLANGASLPSDESMVRHLSWMGYHTGVDPHALAVSAGYFRDLAAAEGKTVGQPAEYDPRYYAHQMPGGMISNFKAQLKALGKSELLEAVLDEMPLVRHELGYPNIQTPFSQFVATQALLNVIHGRYEVVPDEIHRFVLGYWGRTPGEIDPNVLDRAGRGEPLVDGRPSSLVPPLVDRIRAKYGPFESDEDLLLATFFLPEVLDEMRRFRAAGGPKPTTSLVELVRAAATSPDVRSLALTVPR